MPLYEYQCDACGRKFEKLQKFADSPLESCELCGKGPVHKLMSSPAIQFKGSGWYVTDYARKGSSASGESPAGSNGASGEKSSTDKPATPPEKSERKPAETKSGSKTKET